MSLKAGMARAGTARTKSAAPKFLSVADPVGWSIGADGPGMSTDRAMKISTVNRCVEVLSTAMAVIPSFVMDRATKEHVDHPISAVLQSRPNEAMTPFDFRKLLMSNELLRGNAYAWSWRDPGTGRIKERIPLPPDYVSQVYVEGKRWYIFTHPESGEVHWLRPDDVTHYKAYSDDGLDGISVLHRAAMTLDTARAAQLYENSTWNNGGQPCGILTTESDLGDTVEVPGPDGTTITIDPKEQLRKSWEAIHKGPGNAFRVAVLDLGLKYQPISMTNADAQFVESNEIRVIDVCRFFGVPPHLAYAGKQSYASNEQNGIEFVTYTLLGYETQWNQEDTHRLLLPSDRDKGLQVRSNSKVFLRGDTNAQAAWYRTMREVGAYNVDEIRGLEDLPKVPGGDVRYASWNYGPLDDFARLSVIRALGGNAPEGGNNE